MWTLLIALMFLNIGENLCLFFRTRIADTTGVFGEGEGESGGTLYGSIGYILHQFQRQSAY